MYKVIENENISSFDVDNTLVMWDKDYKTPGKGKIQLSYGNEDVFLRPHNFHSTFLKHCYNRGDYVEVWSKNGAKWAEQVVVALGLQEHVNVVRAKPNRYIDDKSDIDSILGSRVYFEEE